MERSILLPSILAVALTPAAAQTLTQADAVPPPGTYVIDRSVASGDFASGFDTVGIGLHWDVSAIEWFLEASYTMEVTTPASTAYADLFPGANACVIDHEDQSMPRYTFHRNSPDTLQLIGSMVHPDGLPIEIQEECPGLRMRYPATLNSLIGPSTLGCTMFEEESTRKVLAFGSLTSASGTLPNVVLVRTSICYEDPFAPKGQGMICDDHYNWYAVGNLLVPVMYMQVASVDHLRLFWPVGATGIDDPLDPHALSIWPNPVHDVLHVSTSVDHPLGAVRIIGADGRIVMELTSTHTALTTVEVQHLPAGVYTLVASEGGLARRFMKL